MRKLKYHLFNMFICTFFLIICLFDVDGVQLGLSYWPTTPTALIDTISVLGDAIWLCGILYIFMIIGIIAIIFNNEITDLVKDMFNEKQPIKLKAFMNFTLTDKIINIICIIVPVIGIGSGFWFTGLAMLMFNITSTVFAKALRTELKKQYPNGLDNQPSLTDNLLNK